MKKYDVFISSKSEDYKLAEQVYDFLVENGLSVFLASRELDRLGVARGDDAIDEAIDSTTHMIVVASSAANVNSKWVRHEWGTFSHDLRSGYRSGNLITVLTESVRLKDLPSGLRHNQSFNFKNYKKSILSYVKLNEESQNDSTIPPLIKAENKPVTSTGSSKKRGLVAAAVLALMLLLGVAGYYMFLNNNSGNSKKDPGVDTLAQKKVIEDPLEKSKNDTILDESKYDWLAKRYVTNDDIEKCHSANDVRLLRNSIYARHGYIFRDDSLNEYFSKFKWYKGVSRETPKDFNRYENANIIFLNAKEKQLPSQ